MPFCPFWQGYVKTAEACPPVGSAVAYWLENDADELFTAYLRRAGRAIVGGCFQPEEGCGTVRTIGSSEWADTSAFLPGPYVGTPTEGWVVYTDAVPEEFFYVMIETGTAAEFVTWGMDLISGGSTAIEQVDTSGSISLMKITVDHPSPFVNYVREILLTPSVGGTPGDPLTLHILSRHTPV
jgi:hypothetical protein